MKKQDLETVLEALLASRTELHALMDEDIHIPSGDLVEQIEGAIRMLEADLGA